MASPALALGAVQTVNQIGLEISDLISSTGCGNTCTTASDIANTQELLMNIVSHNYWAMPAPRPRTAQTKALAYIDAIEAWLIQQCSNPALGDAGYRCASERSGTGCPPNCPKTCGDGTQCCCNPIITIRNPIANDAAVYDDSANPQGLGTSLGPNLVPTYQVITNGSGGIIESGSPSAPPAFSGLYGSPSDPAYGAGATGPRISMKVVLIGVAAVVLLVAWKAGKL